MEGCWVSFPAIRQEAVMSRRLWLPVVSGPVALYAAGYRLWMLERGYTPRGVVNRLELLGQLSRWLEVEALTPVELIPEQVERFLERRRAAGYSRAFRHRAGRWRLSISVNWGLRRARLQSRLRRDRLSGCCRIIGSTCSRSEGSARARCSNAMSRRRGPCCRAGRARTGSRWRI